MRWAALRHCFRAYTDDLAESFVGYSYPPAPRAIEDANWRPDALSEYCQRCGDSVAPGETTDSGCATCRPEAELAGGIANGIVRLGTHTEALQSWVQAIKYGRWTEMADELGDHLAHAIRASNLVDPHRAIIVPMPMPWLRRMYRGIDHTQAIAAAVAHKLNAPVVSILARSNHTPQVLLPSSARKRSGSHGLRIRPQWRWDGWRHLIATRLQRRPGIQRGTLRGWHIVLIDDVRTTGSTLKAATRLLKPLKPDTIVGAVLAVSDSKARRIRSEQRRAEDVLASSPQAQAVVVQSPA